METLLEQHDAGQEFIWPLRFQTKKEASPTGKPPPLKRGRKS